MSPSVIRCPICRCETRWDDNPHRPFCSDRCKLLDLGNWVSGRYRVPVSEAPHSEGNQETEE